MNSLSWSKSARRALWIGGAIVLARPALGAPPSVADQAILVQANCLYDQLSDKDALTMVDVYLNKDVRTQPDVAQALAAAYRVCATKFSWLDDRHVLASEIALEGAVIDVVLQNLLNNGLKTDRVILDVWDRLANADAAALLSDDWRNDRALTARLRRALADSGVPDRGQMIDDALIVLAAASRQAAAMKQWPRDAPKAP